MPSGAKKRKAAKKKETLNQSNNHSDSASATAHPHGEEDRESDVEEASSPVPHDQQKLRMEREDEEIEKDSEVTDPLSMGVEESATRVEKEIKIEDELGKNEGIIDQINEANPAAYDGDSSASSAGSSSSSSDDESRGIKKAQADSLSPTPESGDSVVENIPAANSEKITVSSERVELDVVPPADIALAPHVIDSALHENGKKKCCSAKERSFASEPSINAASHGIGEANARATQENDDRSTSPYISSTADVDDGAEHMKDSTVTQLVVAPSPYPIQKTSWKGCCGLFEVFSASGA